MVGSRSRSRRSAWITSAAFTLFAPFLACSGDVPTAVSELDLSRSSLTVAAGPYVSGQSYVATFTARSSDGDPFTDPVSVVLSLTGGTSTGSFSSVTNAGSGVYTASFLALVTGTASSVRATVNGGATLTSTPSVSVVPGAMHRFASMIQAAPQQIAVGGTSTITVTSRDSVGNIRTAGGDIVTVAKGGSAPLLPADGTLSPVTDNGNGTYSALFIATYWGGRYITATINGINVESTFPGIIVLVPPPSFALSLVSVGRATLASGDTTTVTLVTADALGRPLPTTGLTVAFTKGAGGSDGTLSTVTDRGDGTYTALFTATTAGSARVIGATIGGNAVTSTPPTIAVSPGALSLAQSSVSIGSATLAAPASSPLTLTARDGFGNRLAGGGLTVAFTKGTGTSDGTISAVTDNTDGTYGATFTATTTGTARAIGATIGGAPVTAASPTITVSAGPISLAQSTLTAGATTLLSGTTTTLTVTARDAFGNALGAGGAVVALVKGTGTSDGTITAVTDNANGTYTATLTATAAGTARTITATVGGAPLTSAASTITVTPGTPSTATSTITVSRTTLLVSDTATLELTARDAAGNLVGAGGATVAFTKGAGTSDGTIGTTSDAGDGRYRAILTATTSGSARSIGATIGGVALTTAPVSVTVSSVPPSLSLSSVTVGASTVASGTTTTLTLTARDVAGNTLAAGGLTVLFTKGTGLSDGTISAVTDNANGTYTAIFTGTTAGTARAVGATIGAQSVTSVAPTILVTPGASSPATSTIAASPTTILLGQSSTLTLTGRDLAGNLVTTGGATVVFTKVSGSADGPLSSTTDVGNGTYTATFTAATGGAPRVIGATINGASVATTLPVITVTAPPLMALASDSVLVTAQLNTAAAPLLVAVANIGGGSISGLSATRTHVSGPPTCNSVNWLAVPTFDMGGIANPVSLMTLQANATGLELGTCVRRVVVSSSTPGVAPETLLVALVVGRSPAATGVVNVVMMGDASNNVVQSITPTPILRIDNGGRGTVSNLTATIVSQSGFAECVDPSDQTTCAPWLAPSDLVWSSPTLPSTLSIVSQVRPFSANATIRVAGTGMASRDFQVNVAFNVLPELVTNPRNLVVRGLVGGTITSQPIMAFNQNAAHPGLTNFRQRIPVTAGSWLSGANFNWQTVGDSGRLTIAFPATGAPLFVTDSVEILADCTNPNDCFDFGANAVVPKRFWSHFTLIAEPGIRVPFDSLTVFAADSMPRTVDVPVLSPGVSEIRGPFTTGGSTSVPWITAVEFVGGGASTPTTLRLTIDPRLLPAGETLGVRQIQVVKNPAGAGDLPQHGTAFILTLRRLP